MHNHILSVVPKPFFLTIRGNLCKNILTFNKFLTVGCPVHLQTSFRIRTTEKFCKENLEKETPWFKMKGRGRDLGTVCHRER